MHVFFFRFFNLHVHHIQQYCVAFLQLSATKSSYGISACAFLGQRAGDRGEMPCHSRGDKYTQQQDITMDSNRTISILIFINLYDMVSVTQSGLTIHLQMMSFTFGVSEPLSHHTTQKIVQKEETYLVSTFRVCVRKLIIFKDGYV